MTPEAEPMDVTDTGPPTEMEGASEDILNLRIGRNEEPKDNIQPHRVFINSRVEEHPAILLSFLGKS